MKVHDGVQSLLQEFLIEGPVDIKHSHDVVDSRAEASGRRARHVLLRVELGVVLDESGREWNGDVDVREGNAKHLRALFSIRFESRPAGRGF